jgi:hypothetical protein
MELSFQSEDFAEASLISLSVAIPPSQADEHLGPHRGAGR